MIEITDDMLRAAIKAMEPNRIQGFSSPQDKQRRTWGPPHWVVDYGPKGAIELWRGDSGLEMMERCAMERLRLGFTAALADGQCAGTEEGK